MKKKLLALLLVAAFLQSCYREAYYVSPFDANNNTYHAIPLRSDSIGSAWFVSGAFSTGAANQTEDAVSSFHTSIYRTHNLGFLELFYGLDLGLGNYTVSKYDSIGNTNSVNYQIINKNAGGKFFGGIGYNGGFAFAIPLGRSEWRIGAEASFQNEFGSYLNFRKNLPDSAATLIIRNPSFSTLSWWSEFAFKTRYGSWGFKWSSGKALNGGYGEMYQAVFQSSKSYSNGSFLLQFTTGKYTSYIMESISPLAYSLQLGLDYRLNIKKKTTQVNLY